MIDRREFLTVIAHGGIFAWRDGRENPDTFQALLEYPKGFLVSYATSFGNDSPSFSRYMGKQATLMNIGGRTCFCLATRPSRRRRSTTSICITCRTGSSACAAASSRTRPCRTGSRTRSRV